VLVVNDSEGFSDVLSSVVAATPGFEVVGEASGSKALDLVEALRVQFVLMDLQMPELDAVETALRIHDRQPEVVVLVLSARRRATLDHLSLVIEERSDLSPDWLAKFWLCHGNSR
jgi:DNA-binding NarL/FixJ family response regulator